jgi:cyanuric acid amidohydrolase
MSHVNILKYGVSSPADTSPLQALKRDGYEPEDILAVIGKSEGRLYPFAADITLMI